MPFLYTDGRISTRLGIDAFSEEYVPLRREVTRLVPRSRPATSVLEERTRAGRSVEESPTQGGSNNINSFSNRDSEVLEKQLR
jgi:hypothetical protein